MAGQSPKAAAGLSPEEFQQEILRISQKTAAENRKKKPKANAAATPKAAAGGGLRARKLDTVTAKAVRWLWPGRIALGKVTLIAGDPGLGKSQITAYLAGIVTTGGQWPVDGAKSPQGGVIFLSAEDDAADTIRPRLEAVGADLSKCTVVDAVIEKDETGRVRERIFNTKKDLDYLAVILREEKDVRLIVIDPITAYMGGIDSHKTSDIRELMAPLGQFAEQHQVAIVGISHLNKSGTQEAMQRVSGSLAMVAAARAAFVVAKDKADPDRRLLLPLKNNLAKDIGGFAYRIEGVGLGGGIATSCVVWEDAPVNLTADEAMNARPPQDDHGQTDQAAQFLLELLAAGAMPANDVKTECENAGYSWATIRRAKGKIGIKSGKNSFDGAWIWELSEDAHEDAHENKKPLFLTHEHLRGGRENQGLQGFQPAQKDGLLSKTDEHLRGGRATQGLEDHDWHEDAHVFDIEHLRKTPLKDSVVLDAEI